MLSRDLENLSDAFVSIVLKNSAISGEALLLISENLDEMAKRARALETLSVPEEAKAADSKAKENAEKRREALAQYMGAPS